MPADLHVGLTSPVLTSVVPAIKQEKAIVTRGERIWLHTVHTESLTDKRACTSPALCHSDHAIGDLACAS